MIARKAKRPRPKVRKNARVEVVRHAHAFGLALPAYQTDDAAGLDLVAALAEDAPLRLAPGARGLIPTGLTFALPAGLEAQVRPRSGLAVKHGVTVLNSPGTIDADYRGEVSVILVNLGAEAFTIRRGDRIAQMVIAPVTRGALVEVAKLKLTDRGSGGFGSTGVVSTAVPKRAENSKSIASPKPAVKLRSKKPAARKSRAT